MMRIGRYVIGVLFFYSSFLSADGEEKTKRLPHSTTIMMENAIPAAHKDLVLTAEQKAQLQALKHEQDLQLKRLGAEQTVRLKEWQAKEKQVRHELYKKTGLGLEYNRHVQDFVVRRKVLLKSFKEEKEQMVKNHQESMEALRKKLLDANTVLEDPKGHDDGSSGVL